MNREQIIERVARTVWNKTAASIGTPLWEDAHEAGKEAFRRLAAEFLDAAGYFKLREVAEEALDAIEASIWPGPRLAQARDRLKAALGGDAE